MSSELQAMAAFMAASGVPHRITSTLRPGDDGFHGLGLATDFAGPRAWNQTKPYAPLRAIYDAWMARAGDLTELIYSGAPFYISRGVVKPISKLDPDLKAAHWNHVHVAVPKGWTFTPNRVTVPDIDPNIVDIADEDDHIVAVSISAVADSFGNMTGYVILGKDGGVFAFGPGAKFFGRVK